MLKKLYKYEKVIWVGLYLVYFGLRVSTFVLLNAPRIAPDTNDYVNISTFSIFDVKFWTWQRPPLYPLFIKLFQQNLSLLPLFQIVFSMFAWGLLAYAVARLMKNFWLRLIVFTFVLIFSSNFLIIPWDAVIMTESLNFSFFAIIFGLWFMQVNNKAWNILLPLTIASFLWTFLRETNVWLIFITGGSVFLLGFLYRAKKKVLIGLVLCSTFAINYLSIRYPSGMDQRWVFPFLNIVGKKILRNEYRLDWFKQQGMPVSPELISMKGEFANGNDRYFYTAPELASFREWVITKGRRSYMIFLLSDTNYLFIRPFMDASYLDTNQSTDSYQPEHFHLLLPPAIYKFVHPDIVAKELLWIGIFASVVALFMTVHKKSEVWLILLFVLLLFFPHTLITWHGDTMSLSRHTLLPTVHIRIAIWFTGFFLLNDLLPKTEMDLIKD